MATVYRKTDKGVAEITTRAHRLAPRYRSALILVDGKKTDEDLHKLILVEPAQTLAGLASEGFIDVLATLAERPPELKPAAVRSSNGGSFTVRQRDAVRELTNHMGPLAESLALSMERAKSEADLQPLLLQASEMLRRMRGAAPADAYLARFVTPTET
jgi:hypothetical protein